MAKKGEHCQIRRVPVLFPKFELEVTSDTINLGNTSACTLNHGCDIKFQPLCIFTYRIPYLKVQSMFNDAYV